MRKPDYKKQAAGLAALGRGPDDRLVHMSAREVASLQQMAQATGGSLTVNPKTGLPEAGWLDAVLPVVAGGLATLATGGAAAPILAGALTGYVTGDKDQPAWQRAGLGALGGFGGGNLATSLAGMGAAAGTGAAGSAGAAATEAALGNTSKEALRQLGQGALSQGASQGAAAIGQGAAQLGTQGGRQALMTGLGGKLGAATLAAPAVGVAMVPPRVPGLPESAQPTFYTGAGGQPLQYNPGVYNPNAALGEPMFIGRGYGPGEYSRRYPGIGEDETRMAEGGSVMAPVKSQPFAMPAVTAQPAGEMLAATPQPAEPVTNVQRPFDGGTPASSPDTLQQMQSFYRSLLSPEQPRTGYVPPSSQALTDYLGRMQQNFAAPMRPTITRPPMTAPTIAPTVPNTTGFNMPGGFRGVFNRLGSQITNNSRTAPENNAFTYNPATRSYARVPGSASMQPNIRMMAGGGAVYKAGGMMQGSGDGMSDDIPAVIQDGRRAALSDGEFVIPADVVSHLGNGSTNAGASRLYRMMDEVRRARTGKMEQAPAVNTNSYLPG
jgi:hypothetical protein